MLGAILLCRNCRGSGRDSTHATHATDTSLHVRMDVRVLTAVAGDRYNDYNSMIPQQEMQPPDMGMAPGAPARCR